MEIAMPYLFFIINFLYGFGIVFPKEGDQPLLK